MARTRNDKVISASDPRTLVSGVARSGVDGVVGVDRGHVVTNNRASAAPACAVRRVDYHAIRCEREFRFLGE